MKLFNIFDRWGNKIGEVHEAGDPLDGLGGFLGFIFLMVTGIGAFLIWPIFFEQLFDVRTSIYEKTCGWVQFISLLIAYVFVGYRAFKSEKFSFSKTWIYAISIGTFLSVVVTWLFCFLNDETGGGLLFASLYTSFLLSLGGGLAASLLTMIVRHIHLSKLESSKDNENDESGGASLKSFYIIILVVAIICAVLYATSFWECDICGKETSTFDRKPINIYEGALHFELCLDCYDIYVYNGDVPLSNIVN